MKIAYLTSHFPCGPGERFFEPEVQMLSELGLDIVVIPTRPRKGANVHAELPLPIVVLPPFAFTTLVLAACEVLRSPRRCARAFSQIVSARYRLRTKLKNLLLFPKALAVSSEIRKRRIEHIHAQWLSTPSTVAYVASMVTGVPWSCTAHQFDILEDNLIAQKAASAKFIRVISARNRDYVVAKAGREHAGRCPVIHLGVTIPLRARGPGCENPLKILCAANLCQKKGHEYLIAALAQLRERGVNFECDLAGEGPLRGAIEAAIARNQLRARVRLRGVVPHERLCAELANGKYDLFVLASTEDRNEFEGIPIALMEAMAASVPCVSTRTGSIPELIEDGLSSRLVPQRDSGALADAIAAFALNPPLRREMGLGARRRIEEHFNTRRTSKQLFDLIHA